MDTSVSKSQAALLLVGVALVFAALQLLRTWWRLRHIPGPLLASITNFQKLWYGEVVRIGPNTVMFSNPEAIPTVYITKPGFPKADFYGTLQPYTRGVGSLTTIFNSQDEAVHKMIKAPVAPIFSVSSATTFESHVDEVLQSLSENLDKRFLKHGNIFDLGSWIQYFAFDVMGTMTFSKRYGFLDQGEDVGGMLAAIHTFMKTVAPITQIPWLDKVLYKNIIADSIRRAPGLQILRFTATVIQERREQMSKGAQISVAEKLVGKKDFLTRYIETQEKHPELPPWAVSGWTFSNIIAGSDSVGTIMRTIMFHLLASPHTMAKLYEELLSGNLSRPYPKFNQINALPYLDACLWEGARMHPPFALPFERVVPEGGITVLGHYVPAGTNLGGSPYVVNRHKGTFGQDAEFWRPERWLEKDEKHKLKLERRILTFGAGRRICLGKHIGILEVKKLVAFLVLNYNVHIIDVRAFEVENIWFFAQKGLNAWIEKRET